MKENENTSGAEYFDLRPYTTKEMRMLYGVNWDTWKKWTAPFLSEIGEMTTRTYNVKQVKTIIDKLGFPEKLKI